MKDAENKERMGLAAKVFCWGALAVGLLWTLFRLLANDGCILDDEFSHYLFSRSVWQNPEMLLDAWTRPGRNLIHIWAAPFGFTFARLFTLGLSLLGLWITWRVGRILKLRALWALPLLFLFQAWYPELSYPVLTQTPFLLVWILGVWLGMKGRWHLAGAAFGYLSLVRHEGILLAALWGLWVICQEGGLLRVSWDALRGKSTGAEWLRSFGRACAYGLSTISVILVYNLVSYLWVGSLPFAQYFESKPTEIYGSGPIWHYVPLLIGGAGLFSLILAGLGCFGLRGRCGQWSLLLTMYPSYFIMHSLIYWQGAFASGGYYHFLMPMLPFIALLGVRGVEMIGGIESELKWRRVLTVVALLLIAVQGLRMDQRQMGSIDWDRVVNQGEPIGFKWMSDSTHFGVLAGPIRRDERQRCVFEAADWVADEYPGSPVFSSHIAHAFSQDIIQTQERLEASWAGLDEWPVGTLFIWDEHYSQFHGDKPWQDFAERPEWEVLRLWRRELPLQDCDEEWADYRVVVFRKTAPTSQTPEVSAPQS